MLFKGSIKQECKPKLEKGAMENISYVYLIISKLNCKYCNMECIILPSNAFGC